MCMSITSRQQILSIAISEYSSILQETMESLNLAVDCIVTIQLVIACALYAQYW